MAGLDSNTKLLLPCDGADESTIFTDSKLTSPHTVTAHGTAQLDTAVKKWGTASGMFDGNSDYLTIPDSVDFNIVASNSDDWTIDVWLKFSVAPTTTQAIMDQSNISSTPQIQLMWASTAGFSFNVYSGGYLIYVPTTGQIITDTNWHHLALIKKADEYGIYVDGTQYSYLQDSSTLDLNQTVRIGARGNQEGSISHYFGGRMDEFRIQKSDYFNASPNSGKTDTIIVPTEAYSEEEAPSILIPNQSIIIM